MVSLIPLVYRAIVEYRKARHQVAIGSRLLYGGDHHHQPCGSSALFCVVDSGSSSGSWHAAPSSMSPATSPAASRASSSLASPLLRSASRRQLAG
ncbi:hypothetical protein SORBI_3002G034800 [Sorghum bicolor]|uniref:Uncharacterized protein n=1 Tax=Sorghum bicolor TaxID=4558 RepID=A0A1B6Q900_SORBI|nr:hypothetical protein SORBI_3002G034800 [Sorghum bicolor]